MNRNIRLDHIQVYGFDYDYTLAHYSANLQSLIYDLAKEYMVSEVSICLSNYMESFFCDKSLTAYVFFSLNTLRFA